MRKREWTGGVQSHSELPAQEEGCLPPRCRLQGTAPERLGFETGCTARQLGFFAQTCHCRRASTLGPPGINRPKGPTDPHHNATTPQRRIEQQHCLHPSNPRLQKDVLQATPQPPPPHEHTHTNTPPYTRPSKTSSHDHGTRLDGPGFHQQLLAFLLP